METASKQEIVFKDMFERIAEREDVKRLTKELSVDYRMVRLTAGMHLQWEMQKGTRANNGLRWFETIDEWTTMYLLARACDIVIYGTTTADTTFPQPALPGVGALTISEVVSTLVATLRNAEEREEKKLQAEWFSSVSQFAEREYKRGRREREQTSWDRGEYVDAGRLPYLISTANFPEDMLRALQTACRKELLEGEERQQGEHLLIALEDFLKFMDLLARAENHVKAQTAQWVEIEVNSRSIGDMADEMAQELGRLSKRTAYVKVMQVGDEEGDIVQKMRTLDLPRSPQGPTEVLRFGLNRRLAVDRTRARYCVDRTDIENEIRRRQEQWHQTVQERMARRPGRNASRNAGIPPGNLDPNSRDEEPPPPPTRS